MTAALLSAGACATRDPEVGLPAWQELERVPADSRYTLSKLIPTLPPVLKRLYGDTAVQLENKKGAASVSFFRALTVASGTDKVRTGVKRPAYFRVRADLESRDPEVREEIYRAFLESFLKEAYPGSISYGLLKEVRPRLVEYGTARLLNRKPAPDRLAELWWSLRLVGEENSAPPRDGDWVLLAVWHLGHKNDSPYGFGHSAIALRKVGSDGLQDVLINPMPTHLPGVKVSPLEVLFGSSKVPNRAEIWNLWDWVEAQVEKRYLYVDARVLPIGPKGVEFYQRIVEELEGGDWGYYSAIANSCAHGALDLLNAVRPLDDEIETVTAYPVIVPGEVIDGASQVFKEWGRVKIGGDIPLPKHFKASPKGEGPGYKGQGPNSRLFKAYASDEARLIRDLAAQRNTASGR
jgi:hypothetical protein